MVRRQLRGLRGRQAPPHGTGGGPPPPDDVQEAYEIIPVITITGPLWLWSGGQGSWHFLTVPEDQAREIRAESMARRGGFGSVRVEAAIGDTVWRTSVFPQRSGGYI